MTSHLIREHFIVTSKYIVLGSRDCDKLNAVIRIINGFAVFRWAWVHL